MTRRPIALLVSHEASQTGAPRVAGDLVDALRDAGWEVVLWHRWGGPLQADLDRRADRSIVQPANRLRVLLRRRPATKALAARLDRWAIDRTLRRVDPDLLWCNTTVTAPVARAGARLGIPTILHSHEQRDWLGATGSVPGTADGVHLVGCSTDAAALLADAAGAAVDEVTVLATAIDVAAVQRAGAPGRPGSDGTPEPSTRPLVVACGTVDHRKGADLFARAATASSTPATWRWVGGGTLDPTVDGDAVDWVGPVDDARPALAAADVVVLSSRADSFPVVVLEAMALGRPVVATDLPGPAEQLGDAGVLVAPEDPTAIAAAVDALLADPDRAGRLGAAAAARCLDRWDVSRFARHAVALAAEVAPGPAADAAAQAPRFER